MFKTKVEGLCFSIRKGPETKYKIFCDKTLGKKHIEKRGIFMQERKKRKKYLFLTCFRSSVTIDSHYSLLFK